MLSLRTAQGINVQEFSRKYPELYRKQFLPEAKRLLSLGDLVSYTDQAATYYKLSEEALPLGDYVIRHLIV